MSPIRSLSLTLLAAGGVGLLSCATSRAQDAELPKAPAVNILNYSVRGADIDKKAKDAFIAVAKYNAEYVANPKVYANAQEVVPNIRIRTVDDLQREITRVALAPLPDGKVGIDQADYIRELGIAFDNELKAVVKTNPTPIVRINAMRLLAEACRSGAVAHYPTITGLITSPDTPPEVKYYAFQAAANLLSAYDIANPTTRLHSNNAKEVNALVAALQDAILKPDAILSPPAKGATTPRSAAKDAENDAEVVRFIRRQAIKALGRCRFSDKPMATAPPLYPAFTLALVAISSPDIVPAPSRTEVAEAVIGICNMSPPTRSNEKMPYAQAMAEVVATGIANFAAERESSPQDNSLPWRTYGARLDEALTQWRTLFNPLFDPRKPTVQSSDVPGPVEKVVAEAKRVVLAPMISRNGAVSASTLMKFRNDTLRADKGWTSNPFVSGPSKTLPKHD
ncbi:MAG TPA: hypothetical protein VN641_16670 [Urbifossiella sp.]|nr:hypothetical protein [Urbifossiella sp.]